MRCLRLMFARQIFRDNGPRAPSACYMNLSKGQIQCVNNSAACVANTVSALGCLLSNIFAHQLYVFWQQNIFSYMNPSHEFSFFITACNRQRRFFASDAKYFRSPATRFLTTKYMFLYELNYRFLNFIMTRRGQRWVCCKRCKIFSLTSWTFSDNILHVPIWI